MVLARAIAWHLLPLSLQNPTWEKKRAEARCLEKSVRGKCTIQTRANSTGDVLSLSLYPVKEPASSGMKRQAVRCGQSRLCRTQAWVWWKSAHSPGRFTVCIQLKETKGSMSHHVCSFYLARWMVVWPKTPDWSIWRFLWRTRGLLKNHPGRICLFP